MAATKPIFYGVNLIETVGATLTVTGEDTNNPKSNLYDREIVFPYKDTSNAGTRVIQLQLPSTAGSDACVIAPGHNLSGATLSYEHSPTGLGGSWIVIGTATPSDDSAVIITGTLATDLYFRLTITGASAPPSITELLFTRQLIFPFFTSEQGTNQGYQTGAIVLQGSAGKDWANKRHEPRRVATYTIRSITQADRTAFQTFYFDTGGGTLPMFIKDADGIIWWGRLTRPNLIFQAVPQYLFDVAFDILEQF